MSFGGLVGAVRPITVLVGVGIGQFAVNLADGTVPIPSDAKWSVQTIVQVLLTSTVLLAQWFTQRSDEEKCQELLALKDAHIELLLDQAHLAVEHTKALAAQLPLRDMAQERDERGIH